jgi:hypothetical protein
MKAILLATAAAALAGSAAYAEDWSVSPWTAEFDNLTVSAGGLAYGALFTPDVPKAAGANQRWATGAADLNLKLQRDYDSGLSLSLKSSFEVLRDRLSYDNYGGALVQKVYSVAQTGLGSIEVGMTDGAGYALAVTGPVVDDITTIDNPNETYFIDPSTGRSFQEVFGLSTSVNSSSNYAKISYYTPRLFGVQVGVSYTPGENREVIPFLNNGPHAANRQKNIWETAVSYSQTFESFSLGFSGAAAFGHGDGKAPSAAGLTDWGVGAEIDVPISEEWKFAFGGGYHHNNTFALDVYSVSTSAGTESAHLSSTLAWNDWTFGGEYGRGTANAGSGGAVIGVKAYEIALGYQINTNLQATVGWQELDYDQKGGGVFYNGAPKIDMNAAFLHLKFKV